MSTATEDTASTTRALSPFHDGDPAILGIPSFVAGSVALGLNFLGFTPAAAAGTPLATILAVSALGLMVAAVWAIALGQTIVAGIFGIFSCFWLSYGVLVLGLTHDWFGVEAEVVPATQQQFLIAWLVVLVTLTLGSLRLPLAFTAILVTVDLALVAVLLAVVTGAAMWMTIAGLLALVFAALGVWVYLGSARSSTGGSALPLGKPIVSS